MLFRKHFMGILSVMLCLVLVSCQQVTSVNQSSSASSSARPAGVTLDFRITWKGYSGRGEAIAAIVDTYNKNQAQGDTIRLINGDEDRASIETLLQTNQETIYVLPYRFIKYFGAKGYLMDLSSILQAERELFYPQIWALGTVDGITYGLPWLGHSMALLYNKKLLAAAGVDAKSIMSMAAFVKALDTIEAKTSARGVGLVGAASNDLSWMVNQFIYGYGSSLVSADGRRVTIRNEKSAAALAMYRDVWGLHAQPTWHDDTAMNVMTYFREQQVAFEILGIWGVTDILKNGSPFEVGIKGLADIGLCSEVGPMMLAIPRGMSAANSAAALEFIRYMISRPAQEEILKGEYSPEHDAYYPFRTPIRFDMADSQILQNHPEYQTLIEGFAYPSVDVPVPAWQTVKSDIYEPGLHQVMIGQMSIEAFLAKVETEGNQILQAP